MFLNSIKSVIRRYQMKKKFPNTIFYMNALANNTCTMGDNTVLFRDAMVFDSSVERYTYIQSSSRVYNASIGPFCSIASNVNIGLARHPTHMVSTSPVFYDDTQPLPRFFVDKPLFFENLPRTIIGADVWIGQGAMIKAGVTIGTGAVIGAGAMVSSNVEPFSIVGGVPAKEIKKRFPKDISKALLASEWWDLDEKILKHIAPFFSNIEEMLHEKEKF